VRIVAVLNQKGGVGKTTTAVNLGAALALRGKRVLLIDADPQGNLTDHLGIDASTTEVSFYDVLLEDASIAEATVPTATERLFVVPSETDLAAAESELAAEMGREFRLRRAMRAIPEDTYDWVLIDCPPSLGLLSLNAMAAANELLIALQTEYFALKGLEKLTQVREMVREHLNPDLRMLGILPTLVNPVTILAKEVIQEVKTHYGNVMLDTRVRLNVSLAEAPSQGMHIFQYKPNSPGAEDYLALADELLGLRDSKSTSRARREATAERLAAPKTVAPPPTQDTALPAQDPAPAAGDDAPDAPSAAVSPEEVAAPATGNTPPCVETVIPAPAPQSTMIPAPASPSTMVPAPTPESSEEATATTPADGTTPGSDSTGSRTADSKPTDSKPADNRTAANGHVPVPVKSRSPAGDDGGSESESAAAL
jgi:chromosome partitioning protein